MSPTASPHFDIVIVGAGMVGAAIAYFASPHRKVLLLEREPQPGYHATGRSAALYAPSYGPPQVRALTRASRAFFMSPPPGFSSAALLRRRGLLFVGTAAQHTELARLHEQLRAEGGAVSLLSAREAQERVPVLAGGTTSMALFDEDAFDIDVDALLQGFLRGGRAQGAVLRTGTAPVSAEPEGDGWRIGLADGSAVSAGLLVNAAGAWVDEVAGLAGVPAIGIVPRRRSAFLFEPPVGMQTADWPAVVAFDESWYFKPDAGLLLGSPANADPVPPHDVVAEELDIAWGIYRIEEATQLRIRRPRRAWAGLRSFVADGEPVCGLEPATPRFMWASALGGYGIQTAPAFGQLVASLAAGRGAADGFAAFGLDAQALSPSRLSGRVRGQVIT